MEIRGISAAERAWKQNQEEVARMELKKKEEKACGSGCKEGCPGCGKKLKVLEVGEKE